MSGTTVPRKLLNLPGSVEREVVIQHNAAINDLETLRAALSKVDTVLDQLIKPDGVFAGSYSFAAGAATTLTGSGFVTYRIGGVQYNAPVGNVTLEDLGDITQSNFVAFRIEIDRLGALTAKSSPTVGGESTAQKALLSLASIAPTANAVTIAYLTLTDSNSVINLGTDNLNASGVTATIYYERGPRKRISGLNTALGAASTLTASSTTYGHGTIDPNPNGLKVAQIAAGATQALTDADTIATTKFGAWVVVTDLAGTSKVTLNAAGTPGVTAMTYATAALALAAINLVVDRLPAMFVPFILIQVSNQAGGTFTAKTTNWDATSVTSTITDATVGGWARGTSTGFDSHQITATQPSTTVIDGASDMTSAKIAEMDGTVIS